MTELAPEHIGHLPVRIELEPILTALHRRTLEAQTAASILCC